MNSSLCFPLGTKAYLQRVHAPQMQTRPFRSNSSNFGEMLTLGATTPFLSLRRQVTFANERISQSLQPQLIPIGTFGVCATSTEEGVFTNEQDWGQNPCSFAWYTAIGAGHMQFQSSHWSSVARGHLSDAGEVTLDGAWKTNILLIVSSTRKRTNLRQLKSYTKHNEKKHLSHYCVCALTKSEVAILMDLGFEVASNIAAEFNRST